MLQKKGCGMMKKIMFVCLGNICRSPMAEFIFRDLVKKEGLEKEIVCASSATSMEEYGNPVYPPARKQLLKMGIDCAGKRATPLQKSDYQKYDLLLGMEERNIVNMKRICGGDPDGKIRRLLDHAPRPRDIADPWYSGDFDTACRDILEGCRILLEELKNQ